METFTHSEIKNFSTSKLKSIIKNSSIYLIIMETFTHSEIQNFSTSKLKSIIKNGLVDIETEDMILKELFEIRRIKEF